VITAAPDYPAELVGVVPLDQDVSVGWYQREAQAAIDRAERPLVVGGTGLYFRAALAALDLPPAMPERRAHWRAEAERLGPEAAHALLAERDPAAAARVHPNDAKRVVRALELAEAGHSLAPEHDRLWTEDTRLPTTIVALELPLDELDRRIEERTRRMFEAGVEDEVQHALSAGLSTTARKIIGLHEVATLPREDAMEQLIIRTRRYAAYQRKWLRRLEGLVMVAADRPPEETAAEIVALARTRERLPRP
jgi:tRNA dimethylallyltransferase